LRRLYQAEAGRQSLLVESIHGVRTIKSLNLEPRRQESWKSRPPTRCRLTSRSAKISLAANTLTQFVERGLTVAIVVAGAFEVFAGG